MKKSDYIFSYAFVKQILKPCSWLIAAVFYFICLTNILNAKDTLKVGLIKYKSGDIAFNTYLPFVNYIAGKAGMAANLEIVDINELGYELYHNRYDLGIFKPFPYLESKIHFPALEAFATHKVFGNNIYTGGILVLKESGIEKLHQLQGKDFLFIKARSTSGYKVPKSIFKEYNINIDSGFFEYEFTYSHEKSVKKLLNREATGVAVDLEAFKYFTPEQIDKIKFLKKYDMPLHAYVFSPELSSKTRDKLKQIMLNAHKDPATEKMLENKLGIEQWISINDEYYNPLRRYLRLVRVKPYVKLEIDATENTHDTINKKGDILKIIRDNIKSELTKCKRFAQKGNEIDKINNFRNIKVALSKVDTSFHFQVYLDKNRIASGSLAESELMTALSPITVRSVLDNMNIDTELFKMKDKWFITYGKNDCINKNDYEFFLNNRRKIKAKKITELNTFFKEDEKFREGKSVTIRYAKDGTNLNITGAGSAAKDNEESFWDNKDNLWGVIGLAVALLTVLFGYLITRYKHRRFKTMLYNSNNLLKEFIEGKYRIENKLIEQMEFINKGLEKGYINENQFLILKTRIEDIRSIIENRNLKNKLDIPEIKIELDKILQDGKITEKEYTRIMSIFSKYRDINKTEQKDG